MDGLNAKLPPRNWYTFQQASDRLTDEIGQKVTIDDIVHALFKGVFLPYIQVDYQINNYISFNNKYRIDLSSGENRFIENIHTTLEFNYDDVQVLYDCCNVAIQGVDYKGNNRDKWLIPYADNLVQKIEAEFGALNDRNIIARDKFFNKYKARVFGLNGLLAIKIESLYNGTPLISEEFELLNDGLKIKEQELFSPPIIDLNGKILLFKLKLENEFYISASDLIIVHDDLLRLKNGFRANLAGFAEYADERGILPDDIPPYFLEWEAQAQKHNAPQNEQKTIEKTTDRIENLEPKEPIQYEKEYTKKLVIESCLATQKDYPTAGKNTIVKAVINKISNDPKTKGLKLQGERTYTNILDKMGIIFPDEKGKTIKISKVTIVKP